MALVQDITNKLTLEFADSAGKTASMAFWVDNSQTEPDDTAPAAIIAGAEGVAAAKITKVFISMGATEDDPASPVNGAFDASDKMNLKFKGTDGSTVSCNIPAPHTANFVAGSTKVDPSQTDVAALIAYIIGHCVTAEGTELMAYTGGFRRSPPRLKSYG